MRQGTPLASKLSLLEQHSNLSGNSVKIPVIPGGKSFVYYRYTLIIGNSNLQGFGEPSAIILPHQTLSGKPSI